MIMSGTTIGDAVASPLTHIIEPFAAYLLDVESLDDLVCVIRWNLCKNTTRLPHYYKFGRWTLRKTGWNTLQQLRMCDV